MAFRKAIAQTTPEVYTPKFSARELSEFENTFSRIHINEFQESEGYEGEGGASGAYPDYDSPQPTLKRNNFLDIVLFEKEQSKDARLNGSELQRDRKNLPVFDSRQHVLNQIQRHKVVIISGETGSGKTTQIPQYILEDMIKNRDGSVSKIIVTQPRRISATSVAKRVAEERGEELDANSASGSVGYQIRHEKCLPRQEGSITFCTTGVVLQMMRDNPLLKEFSHVILDEVHERDLMTDFLVTVLKELLKERSDLKLVLMSASMDSKVFAKYFPSSPVIEVKGRTFPVQEYYLEDVLEWTGFDIRGDYGPQQAFLSEYTSRYDSELIHKIATLENKDTDLQLVSALVRKIHSFYSIIKGAILVFLTGWDEQDILYELLADPRDPLTDTADIQYLHSLMDMDEQRKVFEKSPAGMRKIILSTNIAETSVTIEDVVFVVDTGKIKMSHFDPTRNIKNLAPEWVSRSNAMQRTGRAGRVRPGICYHLFSKAKEERLNEFVIPEIMRCRLEEVVLQINILELGKASDFLAKSVSPPPKESVDAAIRLLTDINALKQSISIYAPEELTSLGRFLTILPVSPILGKMAILGAIFSCLDPILSVVAVLSEKDIFAMAKKGKKKKQKMMTPSEAKMNFAGDSKSDHLMLANAVKSWIKAYNDGADKRFCDDNCLSPITLEAVYKIKKQLFETFRSQKLISSKTANLNSSNKDLVLAIIAAGLYPNVGKVRLARRRGVLGASYPIMETALEQNAFIHKRSVNSDEQSLPSIWAVFYNKVTNKNTQIHDCTLLKSVIPVLLFGGTLKQTPGFNEVMIDNFIKLPVCSSTFVTLLLKARKTMDAYLDEKLAKPWVTKWNVPRDSEVDFLKMFIRLMVENNYETEDYHFSY